MTAFYGFDCFAISDLAFVGLTAHQGRFLARRMREQSQAAGVQPTVDQVYQWILAETEDEEQAQTAATQYASDLLKAGRTPG